MLPGLPDQAVFLWPWPKDNVGWCGMTQWLAVASLSRRRVDQPQNCVSRTWGSTQSKHLWRGAGGQREQEPGKSLARTLLQGQEELKSYLLCFPYTEPKLFREMADCRSGIGNTEDEPGASSLTRSQTKTSNQRDSGANLKRLLLAKMGHFDSQSGYNRHGLKNTSNMPISVKS